MKLHTDKQSYSKSKLSLSPFSCKLIRYLTGCQHLIRKNSLTYFLHIHYELITNGSIGKQIFWYQKSRNPFVPAAPIFRFPTCLKCDPYTDSSGLPITNIWCVHRPNFWVEIRSRLEYPDDRLQTRIQRSCCSHNLIFWGIMVTF